MSDKNNPSQLTQSIEQPQKNKEQPPKKGKGLIIGLSIGGGCFVLVIILAVVAYFTLRHLTNKTNQTLINIQAWGETLDGDTYNEPITTVPTANEEIRSETKGKTGQVISNETVDLKVNSFEKISLPTTSPLENYEFYKINLTIKNNTSAEQQISLLDFTVNNSSSEEFSHIIPLEEEVGDLLESVISIPPEEEITGSIIFEIKEKTKKPKLIFDDNMNTKLIIEL